MKTDIKLDLIVAIMNITGWSEELKMQVIKELGLIK